jgi:ABC-2 type transport system ATP-binding protein
MNTTQVSDVAAVDVESVSHRYGAHEALRGLTLRVEQGEVFALLGPNGSGKTTLFRLLSTLARVQSGRILLFGHSVASEMARVRSALGIVFQSPSLDGKLTVLENIRCQGALYGLSGGALTARIDEVAQQLGIQDRLQSKAEDLSGGLKRRVELAKGLLHRPRLLLMDEPSTGLDPASRLDMWHSIKELQRVSGVTVLLTTHLLEEADKADRIAIMHQGSTVAVGRPRDLRQELGEQVLSISTTEQVDVMAWLVGQAVDAQKVDQQIRVVGAQAVNLVAPLAKEFGERIQTLTLGQPSLEDVFVARTGHRFWNTVSSEGAKPLTPSAAKSRRRRS